MAATDPQEQTVLTTCPHDCGGRCVLKAHVKDGVITRIETDDSDEDQLRACVRGRAYRQRVYAPDRLLYPQRRVGERGEGRFERISWDEALDAVAAQLLRVREQYGPEAILYIAYSGNTGTFLHSQLAAFRMLTMFGGFTPIWGSASFWGSLFSSENTYGSITAGHTPEDILHARYIIMWGWNPAETIQRTNTSWYLARAREQGVPIVAVDPRYTDSAAAFATRWIPIRPGTDTAMMLAMAHVMLTEQLHDTKFLDTYTFGFDQFARHVRGQDGTPAKDPQWAAQITGVPAETIVQLAREYAGTRPAKLLTLGAPGRSAFGEQFHRCASTLAAMTGNIGIAGGEPAGFGLPPVGLRPQAGTGLIARKMTGNLPEGQRQRPALHITKLWDAILRGREGGYPSDIKLAYVTNGNPVNQFMNSNKAAQALQKLESVVVHEQFMTATARYADILLPVTTQFERNDIIRPWQGGSYCVYMKKVIEPRGETKSDLEICAELAPRLGIEGFLAHDEDTLLRDYWEAAGDMTDSRPMPDYDTLREAGVWRWKPDKPVVAFEEQIRDPEHHPFPTPSGKIEIYSQKIAERQDDDLPPLPTYIPPWEGPDDPLAADYPLQLISTHSKRRIHSNMDNLPWLKTLQPHCVWISSADARMRGIANGDRVRVFNQRGTIVLQAKVTERIMPGVVSVGQGTWYRPDADGIDRGGCVNVLLKDAHSPAGAFCANTCLVQVAVDDTDKAEG